MADFLKQMAESSAVRAAAITTSFVSGDFDGPVYPLRLSGFDLIAEIKNRSPAEGRLVTDNDTHLERARIYVKGGAAAISVLTEPDRFDGALSHLADVVDAISATGVPVMCKDFLVDPRQILAARAAGASGVLLIAGMLEDKQLLDMLDCAFEHELFVLLESFDELDFERSVQLLQRPKYQAQAVKQKLLLGINIRNLRSLQIDPNRLQQFEPLLPSRVICVAESGQRVPEDAATAAGWGYQMTLVGTALMRSDNPGDLIAEMLLAGRSA